MLERFISKIIVRHLASPFFFIATFLVGVAAVSLSSFSASRELESIEPLTRVQIESMSPTMVQNEVPELDKVREPKITQSAVVHFPHHGAIRVESVEQVGEFPKIIFFDRKSHLVLFQSSIEDPDGFLKPTADTDFKQPFLRFREVLSPGFPSPLIMAVAVRPGGSDYGFYLTIFSEINGKIVQLTDKSIDTAIQGGYYLGFLNSKLGFGVISWDFVWDFN